MTYGLVLGSGSGDGALRTAITGVCGVTNGDLICGGCSGRLRVGRGKGWENESCELGMHLEALLSESGDGPSECGLGVSEVLICDDQ
jgi:hypothetical protein